MGRLQQALVLTIATVRFVPVSARAQYNTAEVSGVIKDAKAACFPVRAWSPSCGQRTQERTAVGWRWSLRAPCVARRRLPDFRRTRRLQALRAAWAYVERRAEGRPWTLGFRKISR